MPFFDAHSNTGSPKQVAHVAFQSGLFVLQSDLTKPITRPFFAQELCGVIGNSSNTTNAAYIVRTAVPANCRGFIPYYFITVGQTTIATVETISLTCTHSTNGNPMSIQYWGRFNYGQTGFRNDPHTFGSTNAASPVSCGYWRQLGRNHFASTTSGTATTIAVDSIYAGSSSANNEWSGLSTLGGASNEYRTIFAPSFVGANAYLPTNSIGASSVSLAQQGFEQGAIPLHGSVEVACTLCYQSSGGSNALSTNNSSSIQSSGIACCFVT